MFEWMKCRILVVQHSEVFRAASMYLLKKFEVRDQFKRLHFEIPKRLKPGKYSDFNDIAMRTTLQSLALELHSSIIVP